MVYLQKLFVFIKMNLDFLLEMNWVDLIVVIFLVRGGYVGFSQGFSVEIFKTAGMIAASVLSLLHYSRVGASLSSCSFLPIQIANFISFLAIFFALLIVFKIVRVVLFKLLHLELFGGLQMWGGLILGLARSLIFASLFLFALTMLPVEYFRESIEEKSFSGAYLKGIVPRILDFIVMFSPKDIGNERSQN